MNCIFSWLAVEEKYEIMMFWEKWNRDMEVRDSEERETRARQRQEEKWNYRRENQQCQWNKQSSTAEEQRRKELKKRTAEEMKKKSRIGQRRTG